MSHVDFEKWARRDTRFLEEGTMLLLGVEPFDVYYLRRPKPNAKGFEDIYETASRSAAGTLKARQVRWPSPRTLAKAQVPRWQYRWKVSPRDFLAWAREKEYPIPQELEEAVNRFHPKAKGSPQGDAETPLKQQNETPVERSARFTARHKELKAGGSGRPTKTIAEEEGISLTRVREVMKLTRPQG